MYFISFIVPAQGPTSGSNQELAWSPTCYIVEGTCSRSRYVSWGHNGLLKLFEKEDMKIHRSVTDKVGVPDDPSWNVPRWLQEAMNVDSSCRAGSSRFKLCCLL